MLQAIKTNTLSLLGRIPGIRKFVPEQYKTNIANTNQNRAELRSLHTETNAEALSNDTTRLALVNHHKGQIKGTQALIPILKKSSTPILDSIPGFKEEISSHIRRIDSSPQAKIDFQEAVLTNRALNGINGLIADFQTKLPLIQQRSSGKTDAAEYVDMIQQFILKSIGFILETNNQIILRTATLDSGVYDHNVAEAYYVAQNISKTVAHQAFIALSESLPLLPNSLFGKNEGLHIVNYVLSKLQDDIKTLYLGAQSGLLSADLFQIFKDQISLDVLDDPTKAPHSLHSALNLMEAFHEATHGSVLINPENIENANVGIADLGKEVKTKIINSLIQTIIKEYTLKHDEVDDKEQTFLIESTINTKKDLADCLLKMDRKESFTQQEVIEASQSKLWTNLFSEAESAEMRKAYSDLNSTQSLLGRTSPETIMGHHHKAQSILNYLNISPNTPSLKLERIVHEISLLAVMDTLAQFRGRKRQNPVFESYPNFQSIPWLKPLYEARCKEYKTWLETEQETKLPTRRLGKELARLGSELHSMSSENNPEFSFPDFCERYKIEDLANAMLEQMSNYSYMGVIALQLELFSTLFTHLKPGEQTGLSNDETKRLKDLIAFLLKQTTLVDSNGKQIIAPNNKDQIIDQKQEYLQAIIGSRAMLTLNAPLLIKFLVNSLELGNNSSKISKEKPLDRKDALLAVFLFSLLLRYLPEKSNDIDSLLKRQEIFTTLVNNFTHLTEQLPILRQEVLIKSLGLNEQANGPHASDIGVIPSICKDMERHLNEYPQRAKALQSIEYKKGILEKEYLETHDPHIAKEISQLQIQAKRIQPITLANLLTVYDQLSDCIQRNPANVKHIQSILKETKQTNGPLLKDLRDYVETLIEVEPNTIINFIKTSANQELQTYTKKLLITKASKLAQELMSSHFNTKIGMIQITDNDEAAIAKYTKVLNLIRYTAYLVNHYGASRVSINSAGIDERDQNLRNDIIQRINTVSELLKKNVILLIDDNRVNEEVFPGQLEAKRTLTELLQEFGINSGLGHKTEWVSLKQAEKRLEESVYREQTIQFPGSERSKHVSNQAA